MSGLQGKRGKQFVAITIYLPCLYVVFMCVWTIITKIKNQLSRDSDVENLLSTLIWFTEHHISGSDTILNTIFCLN